MTPTEFFASKGWSRLQAEGVIKSCGYRPWGEDGQVTEWRANHLHDWCSARGYDHRTAEGQLSFLGQRDDNLAALHFDVKAVLILHPCVGQQKLSGPGVRTPEAVIRQT